MKKTLAYLIIAAFAVAMTTSCGSYLDIQKHGSMGSVDNYYQTDDEVLSASAELYYGLRNQYFYTYMIKNFLSDDSWCGGGSRGDQVNYERVNEYHFDSDIPYMTTMYTNFYKTIYYANLILDNVDPDTQVKQQSYAEAKVIRAMIHFELVTLYKTAPIVDHVLSIDEYHQPNGNEEDTWAFIEQDLTEAINSGWLPSKSGVNDQETGIRVTKEFAEALLGKSYVFQGKYSQGAAMLDNVINSGLYALWTGDYDLIMMPETDNCCESVFEMQSRDDANNKSYLSYNLWIYLGWRVEKFTLQGQAAEELVQGTYGFGNPQQGLYDAFMEMEGPDGYRFNSVIRTIDSLEDYGMTLMAGSPVIGCEGSLFWKFRELLKNVIGNVSANRTYVYTNPPYMRYAEVLLLAAEANVQSGNTAKATEYLNMIRTRAGESELGSCTMDDVKKEKRLELCMESVRFQDLVRWGDAASALAEQGKQVPVYYAGTGTVYQYTNDEYGFKDKHNALPIPNNELLVNENMVQNPGW